MSQLHGAGLDVVRLETRKDSSTFADPNAFELEYSEVLGTRSIKLPLVGLKREIHLDQPKNPSTMAVVILSIRVWVVGAK